MSDEKRMDTALLAENDENTAAEENALYALMVVLAIDAEKCSRN